MNEIYKSFIHVNARAKLKQKISWTVDYYIMKVVLELPV